MIKIKIELMIDQESLKGLFEENEVKFSKKKMKELQTIIDNEESLISEPVEDAVMEQLAEIITDEWGQ